MDISFQASGSGVNAESIGAPPPVCAPKSVPVLDPLGSWTCQAQDQGGGMLGGSNLLVLAALAGVGYWLYTKYGRTLHLAPQVQKGGTDL